MTNYIFFTKRIAAILHHFLKSQVTQKSSLFNKKLGNVLHLYLSKAALTYRPYSMAG